MEDFPKEDDKDLAPGRKKKRATSDAFMERVRSLLDLPRQHDEEKEQEEDDDDEETDKKRPFARRWWEKIFKRVVAPPSLITLETVSVPEATIAEKPKVTEERTTPVETHGAKPNDGVETAHENEPITVEHEPQPQEELLGELIIEHDPEEERAEILPEVVSADEAWRTYQEEAKEPAPAAGPPPEHIGTIVERWGHRGAAALNRNDNLSRSRDKKLKHESQKLKKRIVHTEQEQKTLQQEQKEFKAQVEKELHRPVLEHLVEKQESQRKSLQENRDMASRHSPEAKPSPASTPEDQPVLQQRSEQLKTFAASREQDKPETVLHRVERAAEEDIPIEHAYERRHEIKDEGSAPVVASGQARSFSASAYAPVPMPPVTTAYAEQRGMPAANLVNPRQQPAQQNSIYGGAVKSGFWTAIALMAIIAAIYAFR
jgi:hypothetical protein